MPNNSADLRIPASPARLRRMTRAELEQRKAVLDAVLAVLDYYDYDAVCAELGEISYLLGGEPHG
jgi:hypothetical protein